MTGGEIVKAIQKIIDSNTWSKERFTKGQACIDFLFIQHLGKGFMYPAPLLSKRWRWSLTKTYRFLSEMKEIGDGKRGQRVEKKKSTVKATPKIKFGEFVRLTDQEKAKLDQKYGVEMANQAIAYLDMYLGSKGDKYKSHYHTIIRWVIAAVKRQGGIGNLTYKNQKMIESMKDFADGKNFFS